MKPTFKISLFLCLLFLRTHADAATVDTVSTPSASMHKNIKAVVIKPDTYKDGKSFPVVYLLHGYSGNYADWVVKAPGLAHLADEFQLLIVCADGNFGSWYFDSPVDTASKYETYISNELVNWVDKAYRTIANRKGRAITGLSMGGDGALYNAFRHQGALP